MPSGVPSVTGVAALVRPGTGSASLKTPAFRPQIATQPIRMAHGSWGPAIVERARGGRPDDCDRPTIGLPMAPQATGAVLASRLSTADWNGANPRPTIIAPAIATGVPNPLVPSMIAPNEKAISRHCRRRSNEMCVIDSLTISNFPLIRVIV